jgi:hypothetical protein
MIDLTTLAEELYRTARVLRVFTFERRILSPAVLMDQVGVPS